MNPGHFYLSLDFELLWGLRHRMSKADFKRKGEQTREGVLRMLNLFEQYSTRTNWGVVGLLFCESQEEMLAAIEKMQEKVGDHFYLEELQRYIEAQVGNDETADRLHFANTLIDTIGSSGLHEIGTHSFTHAPFTDEGFSDAFFAADLQAAVDIGRQKGYEVQSLIFPWNKYGPAHLDACREMGINYYRTVEKSPLHHRAHQLPYRMGRWAENYLPLCDKVSRNSFVPGNKAPQAVPATRFFCPRLFHRPLFRQLQMRRMGAEMKKAARTGSVYHVWWHPHNFSNDLEASLQQLEQLLVLYAQLRDEYGFTAVSFSDGRT